MGFGWGLVCSPPDSTIRGGDVGKQGTKNTDASGERTWDGGESHRQQVRAALRFPRESEGGETPEEKMAAKRIRYWGCLTKNSLCKHYLCDVWEAARVISVLQTVKLQKWRDDIHRFVPMPEMEG